MVNAYITNAETKEIAIDAYNELVKENKDIIKGLAMGVLGLTRQDIYYYTKQRPFRCANSIQERQMLDEAVYKIYHEAGGEIGVYNMTVEIRRYGYYFSMPTVRASMRRQELTYKHKLQYRKYNSYKGDIGKIFPDRLQRDFTATRPLEKVVTDITEFKCKNGTKLYLSVFYDLFNNEALSFAISSTPSEQMVLMSLEPVLEAIKQHGYQAIIHSDQGSHYQLADYTEKLKAIPNINQSMSRKGNSMDNGAMESFFGRLKKLILGWLNSSNFASISYDNLAQAIQESIHRYNNERPQGKFGRLSPVEFKNEWLKNQQAQQEQAQVEC